jgi:hypothetical protein
VDHRSLRGRACAVRLNATNTTPSATVGYWFFSLAVLFLGFVTGLSIGAFILPIGVVLIVLGPVRHPGTREGSPSGFL